MVFKKTKAKRFTILLILALLFSTFIPINTSYAVEEIIEAPLNPEFIKYLEEVNNPSYSGFSVEPYGRGLIPSTTIIEKNPNFELLSEIVFPKKFDLREKDKLTSIKDQGKNGCCWAFAACAALESWLKPNEEWDFSENHMKNTHGFDWSHNGGGNRDMSTAYLTRWSGPVKEEDDPYDVNSGVSPEGVSNIKQVKSVLFLPDRSGEKEGEEIGTEYINYIKWALMNHGAVQSSYYSNDEYFNFDTNSYYYNENSNTSTNHAIVIVGWDDDYSKDKFNTAPLSNGAFIAKNSWGENWGQDGYFYISYHDTKIGNGNTVYIDAEDVGHYDNIYQYDPLGRTSNTGLSTSPENYTNWFANVFDSKKDGEENLVAVSFYTIVENATYEIWVDTDFKDGDFSNLTKIKDGTIEIPGYHTIDFESELLIQAGKTFAVAVKLTTPGNYFPIPLERQLPGYTSEAIANEGESYVSVDGESWLDITTYKNPKGEFQYKNDNVALKAFTRNPYVPVESISLNQTESLLQTKQQKILTATVLPKDATNKAINWTSDNEKVAIVDKNGVVTAISEGIANITATSADNENIYATSKVKVSKYPVIINKVDINETIVNVSLNKTNEDMEGVVIVQAFDENNRVLELKYSDLGILKDNYQFDFSTSKTISYVKVYMWDSLDNMKPLADVK